jgi:hypothetical protein
MDWPQPIESAPRNPHTFIWLYFEDQNPIIGSWQHVRDENAPPSNNPGRSDFRQGFVSEREPHKVLHPTHWAPYVAGEAPPPAPNKST